MPNEVFNYSVFGVFTLDEILMLLGYVAFCLVLVALGFGAYSLLLRRANNKTKSRLDFLDEKWEQLILEVLAGDRPYLYLLEQIKNKDRVYFLNFLLKYAKLIRGEELAILSNLAAPYLPELLPHLKSRDIEIRAGAIHTLATLGYEQYREQLYDALNDHSTYVSIFAVQAIVQNKSIEYFPRVLDAMNRYEFWSIKYLSSLLSRAGVEACPLMRNALNDPNNSDRIRIISAESLLLLNDYQAVESAIHVIHSTSNPELTAAGIRLLAKIGGTQQIKEVLPYIKSQHNSIRIAAVYALAALGRRDEIVPYLVDALNDPSVWVALQSAHGLVRCGAREVLSELGYSYHSRGTLIHQILNEVSV